MLTRVTQRLVEESGKGGGLLGVFRNGRGGRKRGRARRGSTPEPHPIQVHAEPQQFEQQKGIVEPVVSHLVSLP